MLQIVAGWDEREPIGYSLCQFSAIRRTSEPLRFTPLIENALRHKGLYRRKHEVRDGKLWDTASQAHMATSFANSRFLVPWLASGEWALFCDFADMLFLADPAELFRLAISRYAVMVVKQEHKPIERSKMDEQIQSVYHRKNWSSVVLWNLQHKAHERLSLEDVNGQPGRWLHAFSWLDDDEIGELPLEWNHLVGVDPADANGIGLQPKLLHYTRGTPEVGVLGPWSGVWFKELKILDATRKRFVE